MVNDSPPTREDYYRVLVRTLPENALVVTSLGNASYLWAVIRDRAENFYVEDAMGLAFPLAIGLAVAQPDRQVVIVQGDGGLLMHMGALVTAGAVAPPNLTILLVDNGVHGASGGQALTSDSLDYTALASASGLGAATIDRTDAFEGALAAAIDGSVTTMLTLKTEPDLAVVAPPEPFDPVMIKRRFEKSIGVQRYVPGMFES